MPPKGKLPDADGGAPDAMGRPGCPLAGRHGQEHGDRARGSGRRRRALGVPAGAADPAAAGQGSRRGSPRRSTRSSWPGSKPAGSPRRPPADKRTLIRRATIDLWGIPPTPEEVEAFEADPSPDAFARLVDRLLASPRYGERWGRHWLDVARYADTKGYVFTQERRYPYAYTYRDYVIDAVQRRPALRPVPRRSSSPPISSPQGDDTPAAGRDGVPDRRPAVPPRPERDHRRPDRRRQPRPAGPDGHLCPLPRPQVRPDPDRRLLLALRRLRQLGRAGRAARLESARVRAGGRSADFERKLEAAKKARDDYLAARRDEIQKDFAERFSPIPEGRATTSSFDAAQHPSWTSERWPTS